ncbi:dual specificity testis-specific protein kinase 1 isoform X1 [Procambarus clarkii]|uniref:dual specificity testis-specific protein kinase 1 isoform X1 n=2 Tax=Procambarus clarkii TaxID=6728 RepID=UPI001E67746F|nr:dual specificity testis-specific protein kinase 1-like isoform X1 [Procambarus clarkii]
MRKGSPGRGPARPVSWCIGGTSGGPLARHDSRSSEDARADLAGRGLARSTSYQALHSALARLYRIDDFNMERIGSGFFSEVFKVRHRVTGDVMVLKMNKLISNRHNMLREVELMNRLHHPNILSYYGVCVNEGQVHALTEYINGGSLDSLIGNHAVLLPWATRVSLALDVARGMAYLHSQGVFHRDLTSKNVLIKHTQESGEPKLTAVIADFGLAAPIPHERCMRLRQVGSPYWMAPEVIRGDWYDHRVDVFSFGIIVCEMIARCEADPDILPRTHNFGVHYRDFYQMCQQDCPALFLQMAFQCCQIEPASRPTFEELTQKLEPLLGQLITLTARHLPRKLKVCHRRSLSDDTFKLLRNQMGETVFVPSVPVAAPPVTTLTGSPAVTPQEIVEKMSAADPYFQPSTGTVNPFTQLKLPARSQLALQEGGRYCLSLPDYPDLLVHSPSLESNKHIHTSDSCLCPHASPAHCQCHVNHRQFSSQVDNNRKHCQCVHSAKKSKVIEREVTDCKCKLTTVSSVEVGSSVWQQDLCRPSGQADDDGSTPRSDPGSGGESGNSVLQNNHLGGPVRRRGSGESGFFSVGDIERVGTPELCLSYSELSTASLMSTEDDDPVHHCLVQRSSSVVTDSSEDLSSLGCCHDPQNSCDLSSLCESEDVMPGSRLSDYEVDTDIRQIVDFFERNVGSGLGSEAPRRTSSRVRQGCLVPLLTHKFSALHAGHRLISVTSPPCPVHHNISTSNGGSKSYSTKECATPKSCRQPCSRAERRDTFRVKDRPKVYITEGTVRAKRDIFEAK